MTEAITLIYLGVQHFGDLLICIAIPVFLLLVLFDSDVERSAGEVRTLTLKVASVVALLALIVFAINR